MSPLDATNASFIMGFIVFVSSRRDTASQYSEGRYISVSRLRYSANHNALDSNFSYNIWPLYTTIQVFCKHFMKIINIFTVTFDQFITSLLKKIVYFTNNNNIELKLFGQ